MVPLTVRYTALVLCGAVFPMAAGAQAVVGPASLALSQMSEQTVPVEITLSRPSVDTPVSGAAVWIVAKFQAPDGSWRDVRWAEAGHTTDPAIAIVPATGGPLIPGIWVQLPETTRAGEWSLGLIWDFSTSQLEMPEEGVPVVITAVDMVRIPEGPFAVGDGADSDEPSTFFGPDGGAATVSSEDALPVGEGEALFYGGSDYGGDRMGPIPAAYPKGYRAFYVMRRELTEGQYAAFLRTLSGRSLASRDITLDPDYVESGGSIRVGDSVLVGDPMRPASHITWADAIAWAAWAGLRPMTELEFEKIARAPGHYDVEAILGGRWERVVSVGTPEGRAFRGSHGLGFVDVLGQPYTFLNADWPGPMALGSGFRGGAEGLEDLTSPGNRVFGAYDATYGSINEGFRAVRTEP